MARTRNPELYGPWGYRIYNKNRFGAPTLRTDLDPVFFEITAQAAANGKHYHYCGDQQVTFGRPTNNPHGYFSLLKWINAHPNCSLKQIKFGFMNGKVPSTTLKRLGSGGLVKNVNHCYSVTDLGYCYLKGCKPEYVGTRTSKSWN